MPTIENIEFPLNKYKNYFDFKNTIKNGQLSIIYMILKAIVLCI